MARILYAPGIDLVSGALSKVAKHTNHKYDSNMFLATHRKAATVQDCSRAYYRKFNNLPWAHTTSVSSETLQIRTRFTEVAALVKTRANDLNRVTADQQAFMDIKADVQRMAGVAPTMKIFLWVICGKEWDAIHSGGQAPEGYPTAAEVADAVKKARKE